MSVSPISHAVHLAVSKPTEAAEGPGADHDGDADDASAAVHPVSGQPAPGGGIYL